jgi:MerR family transcriptional regulator/heat shock protein HspR
MTTRYPDRDEPCYVISVVAKMVGLHAQALRQYERTGLLRPSRSRGNIRLYSLGEIERIRRIKTLTDDLGVNLAGVEVVLRLLDQMREMEGVLEQMRAELERLRAPALLKP